MNLAICWQPRFLTFIFSEFAVGLGRKLAYQGKTIYTLRAIPFGGFTAMVEEAQSVADCEIESANDLNVELKT